MSIENVQTNAAPAAIGPYSQGIKLNGLIFVSGQLPLDPESGSMPEGVEAQTEQALKNLSAVLEAAGSGLDAVLKTTIFIKDMGEFPVINEIYAKYFSDNRPARACVEVARLPKDALVEIEAIATAK